MMKVNELKQLYEIDDSQWLEETVKLIKNHQLQELDLENLVEELEDLGKEKRCSQPFRTDYPSLMVTAILDK